MALKCYPLLPGGLLAIEAVFIGMTSAEHVREEVAANLEVLLLLMFMVAGIYFYETAVAVHIYPFAVKHSLQNAAVALFLRGGCVPLRVPRCLNRRGGGDQRCSRFFMVFITA